MPRVRPVTEIVPEPACESVAVIPPGVETAVYDVIGRPPLFVGAVNETSALVGPVATAEPIVGAPGTVMFEPPAPAFWPNTVYVLAAVQMIV